MSGCPAIRVFRPDDQDEVSALIRMGLSEHWGSVDDSYNPDLRDMARSYSAGTILVAELDGQIVATGTLKPVDQDNVEVVRMSVHPDHRRTGLGRAMVEALMSEAREWGAALVVLETSAHWVDVVDFYRSCGFVVTHQHEGEFGLDTWFARAPEPPSPRAPEPASPPPPRGA